MSLFSVLIDKFNSYYSQQLPHQIVRDTLIAIGLVYTCVKFYIRARKQGLKNLFLSIALKALHFVPPSLKGSLQTEKIKEKLRQQLIPKYVRKLPINYSLPATGMPREELLGKLQEWSKVELELWGNGRASGSIYHGGQDCLKVATDAYAMFALSNPLHPELFPYVRQMESEVIRMTIDLFQGNMEQCGAMTSGGTESILMACKAYRDYGRAMKNITQPELVVPSTAHAAFDKACGYFNIKQIIVPVDPTTMAVRAEDVEKYITPNTIAIISSAPTFPHGVIDPVPDLAKLALKYKIGLHVDCCLGSYLIPFARILGYPIPSFDFSVDGVTTISVDTHKYGYSPKGSSVLLFKNEQLRQYMYYVSTGWVGGVYASPTIAGSRPGAIVASTWATVMQFGYDGYKNHAVAILNAADILRQQIKNNKLLYVQEDQSNKIGKHADIASQYGVKNTPKVIPHPNDIIVVGGSKLSVVAISTRHQYEEWYNKQPENKDRQIPPSINHNNQPLLDIYAINSVLSSQKHWHLNTLQSPPSVHLCVTYANHTNVINKNFINDLYDAIDIVMKDPSKYKQNTNTQLYGVAEAINIDNDTNNQQDVLAQDQNQRKYNLVGEMAMAYIDTLTYLPSPEEDAKIKQELAQEEQKSK